MTDPVSLPPRVEKLMREAYAATEGGNVEIRLLGALAVLAYALVGVEDAVSTKLRRIADGSVD